MTRPRAKQPSGMPAANAGPTDRRGRALVCAPVMPEFDREGGSARLYDFILFLRAEGWDVTFVSRHSIGRPDRYVHLLERAGVTALPAQGDDIDELILREQFDLAVLAFWHIGELYGPRIRALSPRTKLIIDSVDLHFVRNARQAFLQPSDRARPGLLGASAGSDIVRELNTYAAADAVLTVSTKEAELLDALLGDQANAAVVPLCHDAPISDRPFSGRNGLLFVGNFRHTPNVDAVRYLCHDILPRLPTAVREEHPLYIVGNGVTDEVRSAVAGVPAVKLVGWVPSVRPYLEQARVALVPLRFGAGTKQKLIESLMVGTPSVSSTIGTEGLDLQEGVHALIADEAGSFAAAIVRLATDQALWQQIASNGRTHVIARHSRAVAHQKFSAAVDRVLATNRKRPRLSDSRVNDSKRDTLTRYGELVERIRAEVATTLPPVSRVLVISKGDGALLELGGRQAWHFPQTTDGVYAGHYPRDSAAAIGHLETLRDKGAEYLLLPATALWWLEYYREFRQHLEQRYRLVCDRNDTCLVFALNEAPVEAAGVPEGLPQAVEAPVRAATAAPVSGGTSVDEGLEQLRPQVLHFPRPLAVGRRTRGARILVIGVYLANQRNTVEDTVARLAESRRHRVDQRWVALGGGPPSAAVEAVTIKRIDTPTPKFHIVNEMLAREDLSRYEYVLMVDDDVVFPQGFIDHFIGLQQHFGFALAQPARTSRSFIDLPIVEQQRGSVARRTLFVEIGPVVSFHQSILDLVLPFDLTSPMGWGYENVWSARLRQRKLTMGIIDAVPVDHSIRKSVTHYRWEDADAGRQALLRKHDAPPLEDCFRVLRVFTASDITHA